IDAQLAQLQMARVALKTLVHNCEHNQDQPCPIIASLS
ncbi:MAG: MerR family transcriptional regulator, partial [Acinetobacter sp.]|nr:MerR family transcriptional regulator [Acinetobacter sp.]